MFITIVCVSVCFGLIIVCSIEGTAADGVWASILWAFCAVPLMKMTMDFEDNVLFNSNRSPTRCNNFPVYYPDVYLQFNMVENRDLTCMWFACLSLVAFIHILPLFSCHMFSDMYAVNIARSVHQRPRSFQIV